VAVSSVLVERVRHRLVEAQTEPTVTKVAALLRTEGVVLGDDMMLALVEALRAELTGIGPLEPLLRHGDVTDILVNAPDEVWVDGESGLHRAEVRFPNDAAVRRLAVRLAGLAGRRLDEAAPFVDARLPDGIRLHAAIPPASPLGTVISLRVTRRRAFTLDDVVAAGALPHEGARLLHSLVSARLAFLVTGGTGSGKTTILSTLLGLCDERQRLVLVEDTLELQPDHPHVVRLEVRPPNVEGAGSISMQMLVRQALRMRPDRLVVGEVRGAEVVDLLTALNTGHEGGCATLHANSAADVPARLEALGLMAGLDRAATHALARTGLSAIVHVTRDRHGLRRVQGIHVMEHGSTGTRVLPAVEFDGSVRLHPAAQQLAARGVDIG
jgi:pilus assembly protein CpaF